MNKTSLFLIGLLVFAVAAGGMWYRVAGAPGAMQRYQWVLEQTGLSKPSESAAPDQSEIGAATKDADGRTRAAKRVNRNRNRR